MSARNLGWVIAILGALWGAMVPAQGPGSSERITTVNVGSRVVPTVQRTGGLPGVWADPGPGIVNGGFSSGLAGWTVSQAGGTSTPGSVSVIAGQAQLLEGDSFLVTLRQTFQVPANATSISFDRFLVPGFDPSATFIPDAFEVSLLDANLQSVVPTWHPLATSFYNLQETLAVNAAPGVTISGTRVTVDLSAVPSGVNVTLFFDLIGADSDTGSGVRVDGAQVQTPPFFEPPSPCGVTLSAAVGSPFTFTMRASDLDPLDVVTIAASGVPAGAAFNGGQPATGNPATGVLAWTPGFLQGGLHTISFTATDQGGRTDQCTVIVLVASGVPGFIAPSPCGQVLAATAGTPMTFTVAANDPDVNDVLTLTVAGVPTGAVLTPALPAQGNPVSAVFTWTPAPGQGGVHPLVFTVTDLSSHQVQCAVDVSVTGTGGAPVFAASSGCSGGSAILTIGVPMTRQIVVYDPNPVGVVTLTAAGVPAGATFTPALPASGNPVAVTLSWTPGPTQTGAYTVILTAASSLGFQSTCSLAFSVSEIYLLFSATSCWETLAPGRKILVYPYDALWFPVTPSTVPVGIIPTDPFFAGMHFYSQVLMYSPTLFPTDPIRASNGLDHVVGGAVTSYGPAYGLSHWAVRLPVQGEPYTAAFNIWGF